MTTGGVAFPGLFHAWGKQIIAGIGWELVKESVELDGGTLPDFSRVPKRHWMHQIHINPFLYPLLAEEKCQEAGVGIAYYEFPQAAAKTADGWQVECVGLEPGARSCASRSLTARAAQRWWAFWACLGCAKRNGNLVACSTS